MVGIKPAAEIMAAVDATGDEKRPAHSRWNFQGRLSLHQQRVLGYLAEGWTLTYIADEMHLDYNLAKRLAAQLYRELGAKNAAHAVHLAHRAGLLDRHETQ